VDDTVQYCVSERGLADNLMPGGRELAGDQEGAAAIAILDDLHEIASLAGGEAVRSRIIEHEKIDLDPLTSMRNSRAKRPSPWARSRLFAKMT
jgi:hypothetical protein